MKQKACKKMIKQRLMKNVLYYKNWDTNQNDLFSRLASLAMKFVSHLRASLLNNSHWLDSNACPSQFLRHDSYTLPALFDCLQLLVTVILLCIVCVTFSNVSTLHSKLSNVRLHSLSNSKSRHWGAHPKFYGPLQGGHPK